MYVFIFIMLQISTYNCQSSNRNTGGIHKLCVNSDIVFLQEHWLFPADLPSLNTVHSNFSSFGISSMDPSAGLIAGRPFGGVAVLWRNTLGQHVKPIMYDDDRIIGLECILEDVKMLLIGVYLPYSTHQNFDTYVHYLAKLKTIIDDFDSPYVCVLGDFNADIVKATEFGKELESFCHDSNLIVADLMHLPRDSTTHVNDGHGTESWLDHIVCTKGFLKIINDIDIDHSILSSDHFPVSVKIDLQCNDLSSNASFEGMDGEKLVVDWSSLEPNDRHAYVSAVEDNLGQVDVPYGLLECGICSCVDHRNAIDAYYEKIITCLRRASEKTISKKLNNSRRRAVPGWNDFVKDSHVLLCDVYALWALVGKPRQGYIYCQLRLARSRFKYSLRYCLRHEKELRAKSLAEKFVNSPYSMTEFWKEVNKLNSSPPIASSISGISGEANIAHMWKDHFAEILNSVRDAEGKESILKRFSANSRDFEGFSVPEVTKSIEGLSSGRSCGNDRLCAEHFKYAGVSCATHLSLCFSIIAKHNYLPYSLTEVVLSPIVKDKTGKLTEKENYRPIAIASVGSKILERVILNRCSVHLSSGHHQFGFKENLSTDMAVYAMKEITDYYLRNSSPVYVCFLDASKAFDRVNHWKLFAKLLDRGMDTNLVTLLCSWYESQQFRVRWGKALSDGFSVSNGVRQGGILSPFLFNLYTDGLSTLLDDSAYGCHYLGSVNHLYYADDMVLLSPTPYGLQKMLYLCEEYAKAHDMLFNARKTVCMALTPRKLRNMTLPTISLCGHALSFVTEYKYLGYLVSNANTRTDDLEIRRQYRALCCRANSLSRKFAMCTYAVKRYLYNTYCCNISCMHLWHSFHKADLSKFKVCYNNAARMFFGYDRFSSASSMFVQERLAGFDAAYRKSVWNFVSRIKKSSNRIISSLYFSDLACTSTIRKVWSKALYGC